MKAPEEPSKAGSAPASPPASPAPAAARVDGDKVFVYVSELLGRKVFDAGGAKLGKIADLKVRLAESFPRISAVIVRRGRRRNQALDWSEVAAFSDGRFVLKPGAAEKFAPLEVRSEEMLLKEELLDKQVVDTIGAKIERVNDIHLLIINNDLRIVHVDIGQRGILRRLGLLRAFDAVTGWFFEYRAPDALVSWKYIQPLASDPHKENLKLNVMARSLRDIHPSDLADILEDLDRESQSRVFKALDLETAADTLQEVEPKLQISLLESAPVEKASDLLEEMEPDEATDLLSEMPKETRKKLFQSMERPSRIVLEELLKFQEGTAGSLMTKDFLSVRKDQTIADAVLEFKKSSHPLESSAYIFVTDAEAHLVGVITLRDLLLAPKDTKVGELMNPDVVKVEAEDDVEKVAEVFEKYKFLMVPVVDAANVLTGVITFQDIMEDRCRL